MLETQNSTSDPFEGGLISAMSVDDVLDVFLAAIAQVDYDDIPGSPDDPVQDLSWMRQYCSEYGFYQRGDISNLVSIETSFLSLELFQSQCNQTFPDLNGPPAVGNILKYGGWDMNPSNVLFTNGECELAQASSTLRFAHAHEMLSRPMANNGAGFDSMAVNSDIYYPRENSRGGCPRETFRPRETFSPPPRDFLWP